MQHTATENGPTEVDYSPADGTSVIAEQRRPGEDGEKAMLFKESDSTQAASVSHQMPLSPPHQLQHPPKLGSQEKDSPI